MLWTYLLLKQQSVPHAQRAGVGVLCQFCTRTPQVDKIEPITKKWAVHLLLQVQVEAKPKQRCSDDNGTGYRPQVGRNPQLILASQMSVEEKSWS